MTEILIIRSISMHLYCM